MFNGLLFALGAMFGVKEIAKEHYQDTASWCRTTSYDAKKNYRRSRQDELRNIFWRDHKKGVEILGREYWNVHPLFHEFPPDRAAGYCIDAAVRQMARREGWDWYDWEASIYVGCKPEPNSPYIRHIFWIQKLIDAEIEAFGE